MGNLVAKIVMAGAAVLASMVARKATDGTWKFVTGSDSPENPEDPDINIKEAVAFAVLSGVIVGLARLVANRQATKLLARGSSRRPAQLADATNR